MVNWSRAWEGERLEDKGQGGPEERHVARPAYGYGDLFYHKSMTTRKQLPLNTQVDRMSQPVGVR